LNVILIAVGAGNCCLRPNEHDENKLMH